MRRNFTMKHPLFILALLSVSSFAQDHRKNSPKAGGVESAPLSDSFSNARKGLMDEVLEFKKEFPGVTSVSKLAGIAWLTPRKEIGIPAGTQTISLNSVDDQGISFSRDNLDEVNIGNGCQIILKPNAAVDGLSFERKLPLAAALNANRLEIKRDQTFKYLRCLGGEVEFDNHLIFILRHFKIEKAKDLKKAEAPVKEQNG
jgi:hypothetical protein